MSIKISIINHTNLQNYINVCYIADNVKTLVREAIADLEKNTCLKFTERTNQIDYISLIDDNRYAIVSLCFIIL